MRITRLLLGLSLVVASAITRAEGPVPRAQITESYIPKPDAATYSRWLDRYFDSEEIWHFESREDYYKVLESVPDLRPVDRQRLRSLYHDSANLRPEQQAHFGYQDSGTVKLPRDWGQTLPRNLWQNVYEYAYDKFGVLPALALQATNAKEAEQNAQLFAASPESRATLRRSTVQLGHDYFTLILPHNWKAYSENTRQALIENNLEDELAREGVKAELTIRKGDNLAAIAARYAGERDPRPIERYLRNLLGTKDTVTVPLENIMHSFIRKSVGNYAACHGPNCFNTGLNVNRGRAPQVQYTSDEELFDEIHKKYRSVQPGEPLQAGDLLAYHEPNGQLSHVASYVGDGIVFTKNGFNRNNPYVFQRMESTERVYFPDGRYILYAMRPSPGGMPDGHATPYRVPPPRRSALDRSLGRSSLGARPNAAPNGTACVKAWREQLGL